MRKNLSSIVIVSLLVLLSSNLAAQLLVNTQDDLDLKQKESIISEQVQTQLYDTVLTYYDKDTFLLNVKAHIERVVEETYVNEPPVRSMPTPNLPGLPVTVNNSEPQSFQYKPKLSSNNKFKLSYLEITVLVDESIFAAKDVGFIERIIKMHPDVNTSRGDRIRVTTLSFPKDGDMKQNLEGKTDAGLPFNKYIYLFAGLVLLLLLLIVIVQLMHLRSSKNTLVNSPSVEYQPKPQLAAPQAENKNELFYELRQMIVTTLIGNPELSASILRKWNISSSDEDIYKLAAFLKATDPKLTEFLSEYLGMELSAKVEFAINQIQSIDKDNLIDLFKKFREEYQNEQQLRLTDGRQENDMFNFLNQLDPHQVFQLIKDEALGIMAVVLAQVAPETANEVINNLSPEIQMKLPVEIGKLKKIPITAYSDIAKNLSKKAMELDKIKFVTTDGINALVDMLEQSSPELEEQLLASVSEQDISLAEELKKIYISFDQLPVLPDKVLSDILRDIARDDIVRALVNSKLDVRTKILENLPPRTKIMVADKLESMQEEASMEEISDARRIIIRKVRELARSGKIDLAQYAR